MDITKLLDGNVDEVKGGLAGLSKDDLQTLRAAEEAGKKRATLLTAIDETLAAGPASESTDIAPATTITPAGAPVQIVPDVDMSHPAVDNDPRANTTALQNRIDFNDPTISGSEAVERNLNDQADA